MHCGLAVNWLAHERANYPKFKTLFNCWEDIPQKQTLESIRDHKHNLRTLLISSIFVLQHDNFIVYVDIYIMWIHNFRVMYLESLKDTCAFIKFYSFHESYMLHTHTKHPHPHPHPHTHIFILIHIKISKVFWFTDNFCIQNIMSTIHHTR